ncbi:MED6 mediator sub complex component-domain-containing protein [Amylostereum chailletii]|nr:MED6 mediator sub complex component-domain-containing protein [Amylostereum chailletii]
MDHTDLHPSDDYSHRFFIWHEWLQANGPLTVDNVFDYFTTSMFYDKQSNNQVLRMQTMLIQLSPAQEAEELKRFTGVEFALVHARPPSLFVIHKRQRLSSTETRPLAAYFVINSRIYQSPDMYNVLSNRMLTSLYSLQSSIDMLRKYRPDYTPRMGFAWPVVESTSTETNQAKRVEDGSLPPSDSQPDLPPPLERDKPMVASGAKKNQNTTLLTYAMRTTALHSIKAFELQQATAPLDTLVAETPAPSLAGRLSATPAPSFGIVGASQATTSVPASQEPSAKTRKKKRSSIAAPAVA